MFRNWWRGVTLRWSHSPFRKITFRPAMEPLEDRCLLAGPALLFAPPALPSPEVGRVAPALPTLKAADARSGQVQALYRRYLHRRATPAELKQGLRLLGTSGASDPLEVRLLGSAEYFRNRAKKNNARFLAAAAEDALGRPLDASTSTSFLARLNHGESRTAVAADILRLRNPVVAVTTQGNSQMIVPIITPPAGPDLFTLDSTVATTLDSAALFLYTGTNPVQTGVAPGTLDPVRTAILRGRVLDRGGASLPGVAITVLGHPEFGSTRTQSDGWFDLAVNGGGMLTVVFAAPGFLSAQRATDAPWQDYSLLDDVVLVPLDTHVTMIDLNSSAAVKVAQGSMVTDTDGTRQNTLLIPPATHASMTLPDGTSQPLSTLHVRATEYTVGDTGLEAMPGALPANSGYTYAAELSVDEAQAAGATQVNFDHPLYNYVTNFLGFPVGMAVPAGYYDRTQGRWLPSDNGTVIKILGQRGGLADVDANGDGNADTPTQLTALGFTDAERQQLATLYTAGQTLWRVPITHFTPWDYNWPYGPPAGAQPPNQPAPDNPQGCGCTDCQGPGSVIGYQSQSLGEEVPVTGTPFMLDYSSTRAVGRTDYNTVTVPLSGATLPAGVKQITVEIDVAGRRIVQTLTPAADLTYTYAWDGKDVFGRAVQGAQPAKVKIGYVYDAVYQTPAQFAQSFGAFSGSPLSANRSRSEITLAQQFQVMLGHLDAAGTGLGGWDLDVHNAYDPVARVLTLGDGTRQTILSPGFNQVIGTIAGTGTSGFAGDGGPAAQAQLSTPVGVAFGADGSLYVSDAHNERIRKIDRNGIITTIAGTGQAGFAGDGGPALQAQLDTPASLSVGPDGSIFFYDADNNRVRRITPDGIIKTVAGTGSSGFSGDGGPATQARIASVCFIKVGPDGSLYIMEPNGQRVRRVDTNGIIRTIAGTGVQGFSGDGGPATQAKLAFPTGLAVGRDGSLYIADGLNGRVRKVDRAGIITTYAGGGTPATGNGDGGPALQAKFQFFSGFSVGVDIDIGPDGSIYVNEKGLGDVRRIGPDGIVSTVAGTAGMTGFAGDGGPAAAAKLNDNPFLAVGPDGSLIINDQGNGRLRRVAPPLPGFSAADLAIPSQDGSEVYQFTAQGRHLRTLDALTGVTHYTFAYDAAGRLSSVTDRDGNVTRIERDAAGMPTAIVAPFGQRTALAVSANGSLSRVTDPVGGVVQVTYQANGLLRTFTDAVGKVSTMTYDDVGRLTKDENTAGGSTTLVRTESGSTHTVKVTTAEGRTTTFAMTELGNGGLDQIITGPDGVQTVQHTAPDGTSTVTSPDGTITTTKPGPDPRFGMLSPLIVSSTVRTTGGLTYSQSETRTATLSDRSDALSLTQLVETTTVNGQTYTTTFDAAAHTFTEQSPEGRTTVTTTDARGHVVREEVPGVTPVDYAYDPHGRLTRVTQDSRSTMFTYGADGLVQSVTDPLNRTTRYTRDTLGRVLTETLPDGNVIRFSYDAAGDTTSLTPPGRTGHQFTYNLAGDLQTNQPPAVGGGSTTTQDTYNLDRQLTHVNRLDGTAIDLVYDSAGRLHNLTTAVGATTSAYDPTTGLLQSVTAPNEALAFGYDSALLKSVTWSGAVAGSVSSTFDNNFRQTSESVNGGNTVNFQYDNDGLLISAGALALSYDPQNDLLTGTSLGGVTDVVGYNMFGEAISYQASYNGGSLFQQDDTRDDLGRIIHRAETVGGITQTYDYGYDPAGRLTQVKRDGTVVSQYAYDANGNRTNFTGSGGTVNGAYDAQDRLLTYGNNTYSYTAAGELQSKTDTATPRTTTYSFDALGNLRGATLPGGTQIDYVIDGQEQRVGKKVNGTLVQGWLYDASGRVVAELDGAGNVVSRFVYATRANVPDYMIKGGVEYQLIRDQVGSVRLVVNAATGAVVQRLDYDEFGRVLSDTNPGFQPFGFAGGLYDPDTGLVRFGARDYDAETGRWTAKDPIGFAGNQTNLYAYVGSNPVNSKDPTGLCAVGTVPPKEEDTRPERPLWWWGPPNSEREPNGYRGEPWLDPNDTRPERPWWWPGGPSPDREPFGYRGEPEIDLRPERPLPSEPLRWNEPAPPFGYKNDFHAGAK
jgi:RHS repeat-associated protein